MSPLVAICAKRLISEDLGSSMSLALAFVRPPSTSLSENPEKGAFARGGPSRKFVANCAPNLRKIGGISFHTSEDAKDTPVLKTLRIVNLLSVVFLVREGPLGPWAHDSRRFVVTQIAVKLPSFWHFQDRCLTTNRERRGKKRPLLRRVCVFDVSRAVGIARFESVSKSQPNTTILVVSIARPTSLAIWHRGRSHRRPNRSGSPNCRHFASLDLKNTPIFRITSQHRRIFTGFFLAFSCDFRSSECVFASQAKKLFCIASDLGVCDSNRITHRGWIARFGPLSPRYHATKHRMLHPGKVENGPAKKAQ